MGEPHARAALLPGNRPRYPFPRRLGGVPEPIPAFSVAFAKFRKVTVSLVMCVRPPARNISAPTGTFWCWHFSFFRKSVQKIRFSAKCDNKNGHIKGGRDSSVGIATRYGLDDLEIEPRWGQDFSDPSSPALRLTQPPVKWIPALFPEGKRPGRGADHPLPPSAGIENGYSCTFTVFNLKTFFRLW